MPDLTPYLSILVMALVILAALILGVLIYKLFNQRVRGRRGQRLGISEYHELDKTRRLVIVRRDDVEHLILIGGNQEFTIESNIQTGLMARQRGKNPAGFSAPERPHANPGRLSVGRRTANGRRCARTVRQRETAAAR